jgi:ATP-dependent protease HslVU (ClpYQ) peptidase subunit
MSTLVAVRKGKQICIASDSLTTFGDKKQKAIYVAEPAKFYKWGNSYVGLVGYAAHELVLTSLIKNSKKVPEFSSKLDIFEYIRQIHKVLKEEYYLIPTTDENKEDPYESTQMDLMIINKFGMFSVLSLREVFEYKKFWAMGSGADFAVGAMYMAYERRGATAQSIARAGVNAGIEFDKNSYGPIHLKSMQLIK